MASRDWTHGCALPSVPEVLRKCEGFVARLDAAVAASGFLQGMYAFDAARVDAEPGVSAEEAALARTEDFIQDSGAPQGAS